MAKNLTTDNLVITALRRALVPADQSTFTCADIRDILNEEMNTHILPLVLRSHEEYFVVDEDVSLTSGQTRYKIPYRAIGNKLREIQYVTDSGNPYEMVRLSIEDRPDYQGEYGSDNYLSFYVQSDEVVLMQTAPCSGKLRMSYFLRPNELVADERGGQITAICRCCCAGTTTFTLTSFPVHFNCTTVYDFIQGKSPNVIKKIDATYTSINSVAKTITFANSELQRIDPFNTTLQDISFSVGDYIMKAEESILPQLPTELHSILAQRVAVKLLEALGDSEGMKNAQQELERMEYNSMTLIDNRVEGSPQKINNKKSLLRSATTNNLFRRRGL